MLGLVSLIRRNIELISLKPDLKFWHAMWTLGFVKGYRGHMN